MDGDSMDSTTSSGATRSVYSLLVDAREGTLNTSGLGSVPTGFEPLDSLLDGGLLPGEVVLLGGQPGAGKTICALQWARSVAGHGWSSLFACFEHDETMLLYRLLVQEMAGLVGVDPSERLRAKEYLRGLALGLIPPAEAARQCPSIDEAFASLAQDGQRLHLLRASTQTTTPSALAAIAEDHLERGGVLFVDYLQKVPIPGVRSVDEQVYRAVEFLKELAVAHQITVVALSAASASGIAVDRLRLRHLRGTDALAHECDIAILLNQKTNAMAGRHLKFDLTKLDEARKRTVFSVEKNRRGEVDVHLQFIKEFAYFRFDPRGDYMTEALEDSDD